MAFSTMFLFEYIAEPPTFGSFFIIASCASALVMPHPRTRAITAAEKCLSFIRAFPFAYRGIVRHCCRLTVAFKERHAAITGLLSPAIFQAGQKSTQACAQHQPASNQAAQNQRSARTHRETAENQNSPCENREPDHPPVR